MKIWNMLKGLRQAKIDYIYIKKRKALHRYGIETINMIETTLTKYVVTYFAGYGTLLGAIRKYDFIQWDGYAEDRKVEILNTLVWGIV